MTLTKYNFLDRQTDRHTDRQHKCGLFSSRFYNRYRKIKPSARQKRLSSVMLCGWLFAFFHKSAYLRKDGKEVCRCG